MPPKAFMFNRARLQATITGQGREISATEARRRTLMAAARRVSRLEQRVRTLRRQLVEERRELRFARAEFKALTEPPELDTLLDSPRPRPEDEGS